MKKASKEGRGRVVTVERERFAAIGAEEWSLGSYLRQLGLGGLSLVKGMGLTLGYLLHPSRVITQQYPENRETLTMFPRFRGRLAMGMAADGATLCTACGLCEKACPNGTISVLSARGEDNRKVLGRYIYRFQQCTLCGLCVETCPFGAIFMAGDFELAAYDRAALEMVLYDAGASCKQPGAEEEKE